MQPRIGLACHDSLRKRAAFRNVFDQPFFANDNFQKTIIISGPSFYLVWASGLRQISSYTEEAFCVQNDHKQQKAVADVDLLTIEIEQDLQGLDFYFILH